MADETAISEKRWHDCLIKGLNGSPLDLATNKSLTLNFLTIDWSTNTFDKRMADTGQISKAAIVINDHELHRRILTVSLRISNALIEWNWWLCLSLKSDDSSSEFCKWVSSDPSFCSWSKLILGEAVLETPILMSIYTQCLCQSIGSRVKNLPSNVTRKKKKKNNLISL